MRCGNLFQFDEKSSPARADSQQIWQHKPNLQHFMDSARSHCTVTHFPSRIQHCNAESLPYVISRSGRLCNEKDPRRAVTDDIRSPSSFRTDRRTPSVFARTSLDTLHKSVTDGDCAPQGYQRSTWNSLRLRRSQLCLEQIRARCSFFSRLSRLTPPCRAAPSYARKHAQAV